ncbi:hypothetical protein B0J18DRAFT_70204 [Chaetomium sp. MPI-SDFR-AT-0129]|nr:hypothetical protein B0J18DRAFT_70204 [Chaetomium sp. MPI-SDFR-AT-0129]
MDEELRDQDSAVSGNSAQAAHASRHPRRTEDRDRETRYGRARGFPWFGRLMSWDESEDQPPRDEAVIRELQSQVRSAESRIRRLQNEVQEAHDEAQKARSQVQQVWSQLRVEQDANRGLRQAAQSIQSERDSLSVGIKKQEAQIRQVRALAFEGIGGDSWAAGDDGTARADLENLHTRLKSWAKKYAVNDMSEVLKGLDPDEHISFIQLLAPVVRLRAGTRNSMEHLESTSMKKKSPAMCLQGLLAYHVYAKIIGRPFFCSR